MLFPQIFLLTALFPAAHCIQDKGLRQPLLPRDLNVKFGVYSLKQVTPGIQVSAVSNIHMHPDWNPEANEIKKYDADIAVLILDNPVFYTPFVQPICLVPRELESVIAFISPGIVAGYGKSENRDKQHEDVAKVLEMPIEYNQFGCVNKYPDLFHLVSERTFCAGYGNGTGVCKGDSGGGLLVKYQGAYYLRGIVSSSAYDHNRNCDVYQYSVFTDVLKYTDWINSINPNSHFLVTGK